MRLSGAVETTRAERDRQLMRRFADQRDPVDRDAIVERFMPIARRLAARYERPGEPFDDVCTGLQLVNFLQDVPRDLELGRVYLPAEDLRRFGVEALDRPSPELRGVLEFEAERARVLAEDVDGRREFGRPLRPAQLDGALPVHRLSAPAVARRAGRRAQRRARARPAR